MPIIKVQGRKTDFAQIPNKLLENKNLSAKSKGIMCYLLSKPDDWEVRLSDIVNHMKEGETAIRNGIEELELEGYITRGTERDDDGKISEWFWKAYYNPVEVESRTNPKDRKFKRGKQEPRGVAVPDGDNPQVDNPDVDNQYPTNTDSTNTEGSNTDLKESDGEKTPSQSRSDEILDEIIQDRKSKTSEEHRKHLQEKFGSTIAPGGIAIRGGIDKVLDNIYEYPPDVQEIIKEFCKRWKKPPPPRGTSMFGKWIKDAREVKKQLQNTGISPDAMWEEAYYAWKTPPSFSKESRNDYDGDYIVYDIGSVVKLSWDAISNILTGNTKRKVKVYTNANGEKVEKEK